MVNQYAASGSPTGLTQLSQVLSHDLTYKSNLSYPQESLIPKSQKYQILFRFAPRLLSSHTVYFDSNEYATALYHKLSEKVTCWAIVVSV